MKAEHAGFTPTEIILLEGLSARLDYLPPEERPGVMNAAAFMMKAFAKSKIHDRDSGGIWATHSIRTMEILADWHLPAEALQEGGLHDVVEDTGDTSFPISLDDLLSAGFSSTVVDGVGRLGIVKKYHEQAQMSKGVTDDQTRDQELRAMFFESLLDHPSVVLVRIAERLDNLENIWPRYQKFPQSAERTARESLEVYLPFLWELGMYEVANSYADYALGVLYPDQMKDLGTFLPTFRGQYQSVKKSLTEIMGIQIDDIDKNPLPDIGMTLSSLDVYPPSYRNLATLLDIRKDIKNIHPEEVPYLADVVYQDVGEVGAYAARLVNSGRYHFDDSVERFWHDLGKGGERAYYLTLIPKTREGVIPSPIKISFLTQDMLIARQASILHLHQVGEIDERSRTAAEKKVDAVRRRIKEVRPTGPSNPERGVVYERAVKDEMMTVSYSTNREIKTFSAKKRSSVMDVLLEALSLEDLMHCRGVRINGKIYPFNHAVPAYSQIEIDLDPDHIYLVPDWLDDFRQSEDVKRKVVKSALKSVIDDEPINLGSNYLIYGTEYRERVLGQVRERALTRIYEKYSRMSRDSKAKLKLDIMAGLDDKLRSIYGDDKERFLRDAGIGAISDNQLDLVVLNLIDIDQNRLITMTLYIPEGQDRPGWENLYSEIFKDRGQSIGIIDSGYSNDDEGVAMYITYRFFPPTDMQLVDLPQYLEQLRTSILTACRQEFQLKRDPLLVFVIPFGLKPISAS